MINENKHFGVNVNNYYNKNQNQENFIDQKNIMNSHRRGNSIDSKTDKMNYNSMNNYNKTPTTDLKNIITQLERPVNNTPSTTKNTMGKEKDIYK